MNAYTCSSERIIFVLLVQKSVCRKSRRSHVLCFLSIYIYILEKVKYRAEVGIFTLFVCHFERSSLEIHYREIKTVSPILYHLP